MFANRRLQIGLAAKPAKPRVANSARRAKHLRSCRQQGRDVQPFLQKYPSFRKTEFMI
jgi:hypothetical protein